MSSADDLAHLRTVSLTDAARAFNNADKRTFRAVLARHGIPIVQLAPRCRGVRVADLDRLIAACERPAA